MFELGSTGGDSYTKRQVDEDVTSAPVVARVVDGDADNFVANIEEGDLCDQVLGCAGR